MTRFAFHWNIVLGIGVFLSLLSSVLSQEAPVSQQASSPSPHLAPSPSPTPEPRQILRGGMLDLRDFFYHSPDYLLEGPVEHEPLVAPPFNPDPGAGKKLPMTPEPMSLFDDEPMYPPPYKTPPVPHGLELPRTDVHETVPAQKEYNYRKYPASDKLPPNTQAFNNRWLINFGRWKRYQDPSTETPYLYETPRVYNPYQQSILKGDVPVIGQDIFTDITMKNFTVTEFRKLPTSSGVSTAEPNSSEFFGRDEQFFLSNDTSLSLDIFKGETAFRPVDWGLKILGVYNVNYIAVNENNQVSPDPRGIDYTNQKEADNAEIGGAGANFNSTAPIFSGDSYENAANLVPGQPAAYLYPDLKRAPSDLTATRYTTRLEESFALQEAFLEVHLLDLTNTYDFLSARVGIQPFVSDFRGFIFADSNLGLRLFGNADDNRIQYNLVAFDMLEKDTFSDLNTFEQRDQYVFIANLYKQDFFFPGYTSQWSIQTNLDNGKNHYDRLDTQTRPELLGDPVPHDVHAYYLGWTGDGHIGRVNLTDALYQVWGTDDFNGLAGRKLTINAQMAAAELSYDFDWIRLKLSGFYGSGDSDPTQGTGSGFDSIDDDPSFIGGPFSWYAHQGFNLGGTEVNLKQRDSLVLDLRSSKSEGQSNFDNPGVAILGIGTEADLTPKLRLFSNINYIWIPADEAIKLALQTNKGDNQLGLDCSIGFKFRPLLTDNIIISAGVGFFLPGEGYKDIYQTNTDPVPGYDSDVPPGHVDAFLYNVFTTVTFTY
jgi:hypothetical protein